MPTNQAALDRAKEIRDRIIDLERQRDIEQRDLRQSVRALHAAGGSLREIAVELGFSHQRVHQIIADHDALIPHSLASRFFGHHRSFTDRARRALDLAPTESAALKHDYIGTEHLLLALIEAEGVGFEALRRLGVTIDVARSRVIEVVGIGTCDWPPQHPRQLTPRAKRTRDLAARAARRLKHDYIGTEHLLLGLVADHECVAANILRGLGGDAELVREAVVSIVDPAANGKRKPARSGHQ
jgi:hypothetical protein